jgi:thiamine pyrophosphokinase
MGRRDARVAAARHASVVIATPRRAIILADGDGPDRAGLDDAWPGWDAGVDLVVAADGGARLAERLGLTLDRWVGDGDSLGEAGLAGLRAAGIPMTIAPVDKDESDTELAVLAAIEAGATDLTILGAFGGRRLDHTLANVALLAHPALVGRTARLLDTTARVSLVVGAGAGHPAGATLVGRAGDLVSLLPLSGDVEGVTTEGLQYGLRDETLPIGPARGLSNVRLGTEATVTVREGRLLVVETPANLSP